MENDKKDALEQVYACQKKKLMEEDLEVEEQDGRQVR